MAVTGRFAPSPSGRIHLGNILCCLLAWLSARQKGGRVILRIEDLDIARCPRRYGEQMCRDIQWLGLNWDEGPVIGGPSGPYEQSRRTALYQAALRRLEAQGLVNLYAVLALPNPGSEALHRRFGFTRLGLYPQMGFKLGAWHDVAQYGLRLRPADWCPPDAG